MNRSCLELFDEMTPLKGFFAPLKQVSPKEPLSGGSLYEDDEAVYVEAAVPGVKPEDIHVTFDKRGVSIEGKASEEEKGAKYHLKASNAFSYWIPLPSGRIDENAEIEAVSKDGIVKLSFPKSRASKPLKVTVKSG